MAARYHQAVQENHKVIFCSRSHKQRVLILRRPSVELKFAS